LFICHLLIRWQKNKFAIWPKLKVGGGGFLAHMCAYNMFFENFDVLVLF
jgi:hypothetical protein